MKKLILTVILLWLVVQGYMFAYGGYCSGQMLAEKTDSIMMTADKLWATVDVAFHKPQIKVVNKTIDAKDINTLISYNSKTEIITVGAEFYDLCMNIGESAFAIALAHEFGHYFNLHKSFIDISGYYFTDEEKTLSESKETRDISLSLELQADLFAAFKCISVGYDIEKTWLRILDTVYSLIDIKSADRIELETRKEIMAKAMESINELSPLYNVIQALAVIGEYETSAKGYEFIIKSGYSSAEMFLNAGIFYTLSALYSGNSDSEFVLPVEIAGASAFEANNFASIQKNKTRSLSKDRSDVEDYFNSMIAKSIVNLTHVLRNYPEIQQTYIALASVYVLNGDISLARNYAFKAEEIARNDFEKNLAITMKAIVFSHIDPEMAALEFYKARGFALADYNLEIMNKQKKLFSPSPKKRPREIFKNEEIAGINVLNFDQKVDINGFNTFLYPKLDSLIVHKKKFTGYSVTVVENKFGSVKLIKTNSDYTGKTARGIAVGDKFADMENAYGSPDRVMIRNGKTYCLFQDRRIVFETEKDIIASFMIYDN